MPNMPFSKTSKSIGAILIFSFFVLPVSAQKSIKPSDEFVIDGMVKKEITLNLDSLKTYKATSIDSILITNHLGEKKSALKNIKAIKIKDILKNIEIDVENPKLLSEFYFVFIATDDYKVVFSWNEIFNNGLGDNIFLILEKNGKKIEELDDRIAVLSPSDLMTGRRYVKGLKKIVVKRVE